MQEPCEVSVDIRVMNVYRDITAVVTGSKGISGRDRIGGGR